MEAVLRTVRSFTASLTSAHYMLTLVMTIQDVSRHRQMPLQEQSLPRRSPALDCKIHSRQSSHHPQHQAYDVEMQVFCACLLNDAYWTDDVLTLMNQVFEDKSWNNIRFTMNRSTFVYGIVNSWKEMMVSLLICKRWLSLCSRDTDSLCKIITLWKYAIYFSGKTGD